jgi:hypothetical protein
VLAHDYEFDAGWTPDEKQAGYDQLLTMDHIRQLATVNQGLIDLAQQDATACRWMNQITGPQTLARQVSAFDTNLRIRAIIEAAPMKVRNYLLTVHAVSETAIAVHAADNGIPIATAASATNLAFYRAHRADIERLLDGPDPCWEAAPGY